MRGIILKPKDYDFMKEVRKFVNASGIKNILDMMKGEIKQTTKIIDLVRGFSEPFILNNKVNRNHPLIKLTSETSAPIIEKLIEILEENISIYPELKKIYDHSFAPLTSRKPDFQNYLMYVKICTQFMENCDKFKDDEEDLQELLKGYSNLVELLKQTIQHIVEIFHFQKFQVKISIYEFKEALEYLQNIDGFKSTYKKYINPNLRNMYIHLSAIYVDNAKFYSKNDPESIYTKDELIKWYHKLIAFYWYFNIIFFLGMYSKQMKTLQKFLGKGKLSLQDLTPLNDIVSI